MSLRLQVIDEILIWNIIRSRDFGILLVHVAINHQCWMQHTSILSKNNYQMYAFLFLICFYNMCYHLGSDNIVKCFHCGIEMTLDFHEDLTEKHRQLSPNCRFLRYEMQKINEDVATIRQQLLCKVCLDDRVKMTFRPCGHLATCENCALLLESCPICRTKITEKIKTFL